MVTAQNSILYVKPELAPATDTYVFNCGPAGLKKVTASGFEFYAPDVEGERAQHYRRHGARALGFFERWFGTMPGRPARVVMVRRERASGYARPGYVVVTDTVVNGHPVWPGFGNGPAEAVKQILSRHGDFVPDPSVEPSSHSFDPGGFLLRTR